MAEIGFYHLQRSTLNEALPRLLEKGLGAGFRILVQAPHDELVEQLNALLWTYAKDSFLPHGSSADGRETEQPIFLTAAARNPNQADMLVQIGGAEGLDPAGFRRVLDLFDGHDAEAVAAARGRWQRYKGAGHQVTYWQQQDRGWTKAA